MSNSKVRVLGNQQPLLHITRVRSWDKKTDDLELGRVALGPETLSNSNLLDSTMGFIASWYNVIGFINHGIHNFIPCMYVDVC
jgi:hypothetical protein